MAALQDIYKSNFQGRQRFDDGGSSYFSDPSNQPGYTSPPPITTDYSPSVDVPSNSDIQNSLSLGTQSSTPSNPAQGSLGSGVKSALQSLGLGGNNTSNTAALQAGLQLLGIIGAAQKSKSAGQLPALPALPGAGTVGAAGSGAGLSAYGPGGKGYSYQNYQQAPTTGSGGYGYAPRTQAPGKSSYFTYGQGPETQFFQQVQPQGGQITPVGNARGGRVGYAVGGPMMGGPMMGAPAMGAPRIQPPLGGALSRPLPNPMAQPATGTPTTPRPMMGTPPPAMGTQGAPSTMMQRMQSAGRPFAHGGGAPQGEMPATGQSRYVQGPGDGTSDSIPARLSNGEYVMDAQTVSMLGNGDNSAGAKALDSFRDNLRKHKGGALSQGKMAPKTKPLHKYLGGQ